MTPIDPELDGAQPRKSRCCEKCVWGRGEHAEWCNRKIWTGDFLLIEHNNAKQWHTAAETVEASDVIDVQIRIHPPIWYYDEGGHLFAKMTVLMSEAIKARDDFAEYMKRRGITALDLAKAMYPENWR